MSARVDFIRDEFVLAQVARPIGEPLSVDLPKGDLVVKEQCCSLVSDADLSTAHADLVAKAKKASEKAKAKPRIKWTTGPNGEKVGTWQPCGHPASFADFGDQCYHCVLENPPEEKELSRRRIDRRQRAAQRVLVGHAPLYTAHDTNNDGQLDAPRRGKWFPVSACRIVPLDAGMSLEQWSNGKVDRHGVFHCGSVWTCPSCSQRIAVPRAIEIRDVQIAIREGGGVTFMVTWTIPHDRVTPLAVSMDRLKKAFRFFRQDKTLWKRLIEECGYAGHVTSTEVTLALKMDPNDPLTFFDNGWHCHAHSMMAFVFDGAADMSRAQDAAFAQMLKDKMFVSWSNAVMKAGAPRQPSYEHGFDVRVAWSATTYAQKMEPVCATDAPSKELPTETTAKRRWGIEAELTKSYMKEGRKRSRTPFELLDSDDPRDHDLFREYARATFGRSQIEWSRGRFDLRKRFPRHDPNTGKLIPIDDRSDEEIAAADVKWDFADERKVKGGAGDHVVEQVFIARDDCWRARKLGRNALARSIADVDGGGCDSLELALRQNGFVVERVADACVRQRVVLDEDMAPVSERRFVWIVDRETGDERQVLEWVDVVEDVHIPKMVWVTFPSRVTNPAD